MSDLDPKWVRLAPNGTANMTISLGWFLGKLNMKNGQNG